MHYRILVLLALFMAASWPARGASAGADDSSTGHPAADVADTVPEAIAMAPLVVDGVLLFKVRGVQAYPAEVRAEEIVARISAIAREQNIAVDSLKVEERPLGSAIVAGNRLVMTVLEADARVEGIERAVLAQVYLQKIAQSIARYRSDREPEAIARGAGFSAAALATLAVALYLLWRLRRRTYDALERRYRARLEHLQIAGFKLLHAERLWGGLRSVVAAAFWLLALACAYIVAGLRAAAVPRHPRPGGWPAAPGRLTDRHDGARAGRVDPGPDLPSAAGIGDTLRAADLAHGLQRHRSGFGEASRASTATGPGRPTASFACS